MKYIEIRLGDEGSYVVKPEDVGEYIQMEIESLTDNMLDDITLSVVEMTEEEYEKLPEFQG